MEVQTVLFLHLPSNVQMIAQDMVNVLLMVKINIVNVNQVGKEQIVLQQNLHAQKLVQTMELQTRLVNAFVNLIMKEKTVKHLKSHNVLMLIVIRMPNVTQLENVHV